MNFPLSMTFKVAAFAPQIYVQDANGNNICYVRQKLLKLRENISIFKDESKSEIISEIHADRIIDFSATYRFLDATGVEYGSVKRKGMRSLWKTHYEVFEQGLSYTIREGNPWTKVIDALLGEVPILGMFTGYFFNPHYDVTDNNGMLCYTLKKEPSFFGRKFTLTKQQETGDDLLTVMSLIMMTLLERRRG